MIITQKLPRKILRFPRYFPVFLVRVALKEKLAAFTHKSYHIQAIEGKFEDKKVLLETLQTVSQNLHGKGLHRK